MKLKTLLIPLVGLTGIASVVPLTVSCGKKTIYDSPINLKDFVANRKNFKRLTERYNKSETISTSEANKLYVDAVQHNKYTFYDDIFEDIAASSIWDEQGNDISGTLQIKDVSVEKANTSNKAIASFLSGSADLNQVNFKLNEAFLFFINELGFDGKITCSKVPFSIYYDTDINKWRFQLSHLDLFEDWSISVDGTIYMNDHVVDAPHVTWNKDNVTQEIIAGITIKDLLNQFHMDLYYYKGIGSTEH